MTTSQKFKQFTTLVYAEQAKAFLNAYWDELVGETENIWSWAHQFIELDHERQKEGNDLDEFNAHRFLERMGETKTVKQMRDELRAIDMDFNKRMALIEFLCYRYSKSIEDFVRRPQGDNTEEVKEAQRQLEEAQRALQNAQDAVRISDEAANLAAVEAKEARDSAELAKRQENEAKASAREAQNRADEAASAEAELRDALSALHREEESFNQRVNDLRARSEDQSLGVVSRNKAANELAQTLASDPLPLRQAKITTEAATKKAERARVAAEQASEVAHGLAQVAERSRIDAERAARAAEESRNQAENRAEEARQAAQDAERACGDAENYLEELRSRPGGGQGALWWIDRELQEVKKYLPKRRQ